ncbi:hypothetical protein F5Y18DRAFT_427455 [Xylariaceae sp. FL1019]|nr:hypothetical protein F5Y18DRAFT_427455 [Xylariaceae sp. FL1019]
MGAKASKPAQTAARRYPSRTPGSVPPSTTAQRPAARPAAQTQAQSRQPQPGSASFTKDEAIRADGRDPDLDASANAAFSERLRQMGVADPNPTLSNSSTVSTSPTYIQTSASASPSSPSYPSRPPTSRTSPPQSQNRTLNALQARAALQAAADAEFEDPSHGRSFLDANTLKQILVQQERGVGPRAIEAKLKLKSGVVARIGPPGVAFPVQGAVNKQTWGGLSE